MTMFRYKTCKQILLKEAIVSAAHQQGMSMAGGLENFSIGNYWGEGGEDSKW